MRIIYLLLERFLAAALLLLLLGTVWLLSLRTLLTLLLLLLLTIVWSLLLLLSPFKGSRSRLLIALLDSREAISLSMIDI